MWQAPCAWFGLRVDLTSNLPIYAVSNDATQGKSDVTDCSDETVALKFYAPHHVEQAVLTVLCLF